MGRLNLYKGLNKNYETIEANGKLKDILPEVDFSHCVIIKAGERLTADYEVQPEDIIFLRVTPAGATAVAVVSLVIAVVSTGLSVAAAVYANKVQQDAQDELDKAQQEANELAQKTKQLPFLKGANNRTALGYSIPYVMGSIYNTPYLLTSGFYSIGGTDGKKQYWNAILTAGFKNQLIQSVSIGNNSVLKGSATIETDEGSVSYIPEGLHDVDSTSVYYDSENKIEILSSGESTIKGLQQKVTSTSYSDEIKHDYGEAAEPLIKQLESNTMKVDICIGFDGLRKYDEEEGWQAKTVNFSFEWTNNASDENPTWHSFDYLSITKCTNETIRFQKSYTFGASDAFGKDISVRITRTNAEEESSSNETARLLYINCWAYDTKKSSETTLVACRPIENPWRDKTSRIAVKMIANDSTKDSLDSINVMSYGLARIWDSESQSWSDTKYPTRNPAAWILELLTSDAHSHSKYADSEIDLDSLGALYEYCNEENFYCDGLIETASKKRNIISNILNECNSTIYINNEGLLSVAIDKAESTPIALLNAQSIKSVTVAKSFERKADGQKVTFTNRDSWAVDNAYITLDGETDSEAIYDANKTLTENALNYVTTYKHAYKLVHRALAQQKLQPREITVNVGQEGDYYPLYSLVMLQMKELLQGLSNGVIKSFITQEGELSGLNLSDKVDFSDTSKRYGIIIQACNDEGKEHIYAEITGSGYTDTVYFKDSLTYSVTPETGNIYSIGELDSDGSFKTVTNLMKIYGLKPSSEGWELTLKDYNSAIYDSGDIPEYKSNLTLPRATGSQLSAPTYGEVCSIAGEFANVTLAKVSKLFNSQLVQIYRESDSTLSESDLPYSELVYNFTTKAYSWTNPDSAASPKSNGWSWTYPADATNTVYTSYATAQSQDVTASIEADDWSSPIPSGNDGASGMNSYTITLYAREDEAPEYKPAALTYSFSDGVLSGALNGWALSIPSAVDNDSPCWEIHALAISENEEASIPTSKWSAPIQITSNGISSAEVREIVKEELTDVVETPNVFADYTSAVFAVNAEKKTLKAQEVKITVHVLQTSEELDFTFDTEKLEENLPEGWSYSIDNHSLLLKVNAGSKIVAGKFIIPIIYQSYKYHNQLAYTIEDESYILTSEDSPLGYSVYYPDSFNYDLGFTYSGIEGGVYLGKIDALEDIPEDCTIGDYFTWSGANTASDLSQEGSFKLCGVYFYAGDANSWRWEKDTDSLHIAGTMSDVLGLANADLETNNSKAYEYLNHLTANSIFTDLLTANTAFISKLVGNEAIIQGTSENNYLKKAIADSEDDLAKAISADEDKTVIQGGYLKTSLIDVDTILGKNAKFSGTLESATGRFSGSVTASDLKITKSCQITDYFSVDENGKVTSKSGVFEDCEADSLTVKNGLFSDSCEFRGTIYSGPLTLSNETPSGASTTYKAGSSLYLLNTKGSIVGKYIGTYGNLSFSYYNIYISDSRGYYRTYNAYLILYDENKTQIYARTWTDVYSEQLIFDFDITIQEIIKEGSKTFKLTDLPTTKPAESGIVYKDGNYLKIS